jgi:crossover junction endodeoxyribonuclease RuvC
MRVLGIDPGLTRCGVGIVSGTPGSTLLLEGVGVIMTPADNDLDHRLLSLHSEITQWVQKYSPDVIAVERVFSQAAGIALLVAAQNNIPVFMHTPSEVKAAVTGSGRANKAQVSQMVKRLLNLQEIPKPADSADALALAICHIWRGGANSKIKSAVAAEKKRLAALR